MELLAVIAIVATLVALLLPALGAARSSARRTTCMNNLRQIGLGLNSHHSAHGRFPPGGIEWRPAGGQTQRQLSWVVFLLPFLEQQELYDQLDLSQPFDSPRNAPAAATILSWTICPSSRRGVQRVEGRGPTDYGGIFGERIQGPNVPPKGMMVYDKAYCEADITDGLSKTLAVAEDTRWPEGQWINGRILFDQAYPVNAAPAFENDIRSDHPGGAYGVLADASVRLLTNDMELDILAAYCTRALSDP